MLVAEREHTIPKSKKNQFSPLVSTRSFLGLQEILIIKIMLFFFHNIFQQLKILLLNIDYIRKRERVRILLVFIDVCIRTPFCFRGLWLQVSSFVVVIFISHRNKNTAWQCFINLRVQNIMIQSLRMALPSLLPHWNKIFYNQCIQNGGTDFNLVVTNAQTNAGWLMFNLKFKESQVDSLNSKFHLLVLLLYYLHCNIVKDFVWTMFNSNHWVKHMDLFLRLQATDFSMRFVHYLSLQCFLCLCLILEFQNILMRKSWYL